MKIIQLNIWQGKLGQQIIDFLQTENPDFVCIQEVNDLAGRAGYKFFATLNEIREGGGFANSVMSATYASRYMEREMQYGNAILSNLPVTSKEIIFTHGEYRRNFDIEAAGGDGNIRNLQHITVDVGGKPLHILNHHGYWIYGSKAGSDETLEAMRIIADTIDSLDGPIILCGDFNLAPDSESVGVVNSKLRNLSAECGLKSTYSHLSVVKEVCDYIFVNNHIKVRFFKMSEALVSDHKALILEFDL